MQIGWREFIKRRFRKPSKYHSVGIEYGVNDVHICALRKVNGQLTWVKQYKCDADDWQDALKAFVDEHKLQNTRCVVALSISKYQLLQVDKPAVPDAEINQALQWTVKEQLFSDGELAVDYFDLPAAPANSKKINVVAIGQHEIIEIRNGVLQAGLQLESIGAQELAMCNLLPNSDEAAIMLHQNVGEQICLSIVKNQLLYFSRRLRSYENLANFSEQELQMGVVDNLALEIQRSMDYFESQLRQAPIKKVYMSLDTPHQDVIAQLIKAILFINIEPLLPDIALGDTVKLSPESYASLGTAMDDKIGLSV